MLLPIAPDESIDLGRLREELEVLVSAELAGCYTNGTAGELHALDEAEHDAVSEIVAQRCGRAGVAFQIGASHMSGQVSLSRIARARSLQPAAIQVVLPDWLPLSPIEVRAAVERMVSVADPVPIVLYNPPHAKTVCTPEQMADLANELPGLIGVKVAGDDEYFLRLHAAAPQLSLFAPGHFLAHARHLGAVGSYSNIACLDPAGALAWERQMDADPDGADAFGRRILDFFDQYMKPLKAQGYSDTALDKALAAVGGWAPVGTRTRWPYSAVPDEEIATLRPIARAALPELFVPVEARTSLPREIKAH